MSNGLDNLQLQEYITQGKTLFTAQMYEEALRYFKMAEEEDPMERECYLMQGESLIMLDRFDEAEDAYRKMLLISKNDGEAYFHLGNVAYLRNKADEGRAFYAQAVNAGYDAPQMYMNTGFMLYNEGQYEAAIASFNKALTRDKFLAEAHLNKAQAYIALGKLDEAIQAFDNMIQHVPEVFEGHHYKLMLLLQQGRREEANEVADNMGRMFPDDLDVLYDKLLTIEASGQPEVAFRYYNDHFADSCEPRYLFEKAKILTGIPGHEKEALALFEQMAENKESEYARQAQFYAVITAMAMKDYNRALRNCDELLKDDEKDESTYNALYFRAYLLDLIGDAVESKKAYEFAIAELRMASMKDPGTLDYYVLRVMALKNIGEYRKALDLANYLLTLNPQMSEALYIRADLYSLMHMDAEARADREALKKNPGVYGGVLQFINEGR